MKNYHRILSLDSAIAVVQFDKDGTEYQRKYFLSYPDSVMVMKFTANKKGKQNLVLSYCPNSEAESYLSADGNNGLVYTGVLDNNKMKFAFRIKALHKGGILKTENSRIIVKDADEVVFLLTADTDYKINFNPDFNDPQTYVGKDPEQTTLAMMNNALEKGYDELIRNHKTDYTALFNRVQLQINPEAGTPDLPTYKRLDNYRKGVPDYQLEQLYYQFGRYLLIASSRPGNMPANLQGIVAQQSGWSVAGGLSQQYQHSNELLACMFRQPFRMHMAVNRFYTQPGKTGREDGAILFQCPRMDSVHFSQYFRIHRTSIQ